MSKKYCSYRHHGIATATKGFDFNFQSGTSVLHKNVLVHIQGGPLNTGGFAVSLVLKMV